MVRAILIALGALLLASSLAAPYTDWGRKHPVQVVAGIGAAGAALVAVTAVLTGRTADARRRSADDALAKAKAALRANVRLTERILDTTPQIVYVHDLLAQANVYVNKHVTTVLGYTPEQIQSFGAGFLPDLMHPDDLARMPARGAAIDALKKGEVHSFEYRLRHADGSWRWLLSRDTVFTRAPDGRPHQVLGTALDITDRKLAEDALRRSEAEYRGMFDQTAVGVVQVEPATGRFLRVNRRFCEITGYDEAELLQRTFRDITHPEDLPSNLERYQPAVDAGGSYAIEKRYVCKAGATVWVHVAGSVVTHGGSDGGRVVCVVQDVTDRRNAEEALRRTYASLQETAERYRLAMEAAVGIVYELDMTTGAVSRSPGVLALLGWRLDEVPATGTWWYERVHPDDLAATRAAIDSAVAPGGAGTFSLEYRMRHRDGRWVDVWDRALIVRDAGAGGRATRVVGNTIDVSDRKRVERALRSSEARHRQIIDEVRQLVWVTDAAGDARFFNRGWHAYTGTAAGGVGAAWQRLVHADDVPAVAAARDAGLASGEPYECEYRLRRHDGTYRWHLARVVPLKDADGRIENWFGTATDIDEVKRAQEGLLRAKDAAESASAAKDRFLAVLSHELRTPLTPVLTTVQMLERDPTLSASVRESLAVVRRNVELEARLIDDLLDLNRIAHGKLELHLGATDVHAKLDNVLQIIDSDLRARQLHVAVRKAAGKCHVTADPARVQQVLWNLLKNAVKFTPSGGNVEVRTRNTDGGELEVEVADTGIGIEPHVLPKLFEPFEQGSKEMTRMFGGLGLGLTISKALVERHGGSLAASSAGKDRGATFTIRLPNAAPPPAPADASAGGGSPAAGGAAGRRVLLVEDHADTAKVMARVLRAWGYHVFAANDVGTALRIAAAERFDLLISDIGLPDGTGLELMRELLARRPIKGIALTGYGLDSDIQATRSAGFDAHLTKPIKFGDVEDVIRQLSR